MCYKELEKEAGVRLRGLDLVRAILRPRLNTTLEMLGVEDIEDKF